jgi:MFS family permease
MISVALLAAFVYVELRSREPLVDLRILKKRPLAVSCLVYVAYGFTVNMLFLAIPIVAQQPPEAALGLTTTAFMTSILLFPLGMAGAVSAPVTTWLDAHLGGRGTLVAAMLANSSAFLLLFVGNGSFIAILGAAALVGAGGGVALTQAMNVVTLTSPADRIAGFSGLAFVVKAVGGTLGVQLSGSIMASGSEGGTLELPAFGLTMAMGGIISLIAMASCLLLPRTLDASAPIGPAVPTPVPVRD